MRTITAEIRSTPSAPSRSSYINQGADVMLTGGLGVRAIGFFQQAGIQPVTGAGGTVRQVIEQYLIGQLTATVPCHESVSHCQGEHGHHNERKA